MLLADDLSPADTAGLDPSSCLGIATELGGPTSHTSIISRQLGIPCVVAARRLGEIADGEPVLFDATVGTLETGVDEAEAGRRVAADRERAETIARWRGPARTLDGVRVRLAANIQDPASSAAAAAAGVAEGVGLARTELTFLSAQVEPSVDEQVGVYSAMLDPWDGQRVVIRTLDAGSDKPVPYATLRDEPNPALGVRGLRTSGPYPTVLHHQLDALAIAAAAHPQVQTSVMAPMVSTLAEAEWFASLVRERNEELGSRMLAGIMIEVPSAAILIDQFVECVDFVSVGTNDLAQYTMAVDRQSADLAEYSDPWQPAPLALMRRVLSACAAAGTPCGVCGEAASDPVLACVLVGWGASSLSMPVGAIPAVGAMLGRVTMDECRCAGEALIGARDAGEGRYRARAALGLVPAP
ncbi:PEP-utilizing enzyme [Actinomyces sp. B33]|nr:PEP-utilizing enzyme [Actinomyces sp. B33]